MAGKRNLRQVLDAYYDISGGTELDDVSAFTGWTAVVPHWFNNSGFGSQAINGYNTTCQDSLGNYPHNDGVVVNIGANTATIPVFPINSGLKHYWQQMQAMKNALWGYGTDYDGSSPSSAITATGNGSGTYKNTDISMGDMRGFEYSSGGSANSAIWPSLLGTQEYLYNTGEISIGSTS